VLTSIPYRYRSVPIELGDQPVSGKMVYLDLDIDAYFLYDVSLALDSAYSLMRTVLNGFRLKGWAQCFG